MKGEAKGFVNGLKEFLAAVKEAEKSGQQVKRTGVFEGLDVKVRYGYSAKTGVFPGKAPGLDIQDKGDKLIVSARLPMKENDVNLKLIGNALEVKAKTSGGVVKKTISIERAKRIKRIEKASLKGGILTIILSKKERKKSGRLKIWRKIKWKGTR